MTTTEFKRTVQQFHEHLYNKLPEAMGVMKIVDQLNGIKLILSAKAVQDGLTLIWERVVPITEDKLDIGLGTLVDGLLSLAHFGDLSVENGYNMPFEYSGFEVEDKWFLDFGSGVKIPAHRLRVSESRTSRILAHLKTPWPEWRCAPGYPEKLRGVFGWNARWAEAHAERAARASFKMLANSYKKLNAHSDKGAVQLPGRGFEPTQDHDNQDWPQSEL